MAIYLDCNATTPIEPEVREAMLRYLTEDFGNAGSRTHAYGAAAKRALQHARDQVAELVGVQRDEVVFTSGATESDNLAILGLTAYGERENRRHILSSRLEHKAVLEPLEELARRGFEVEYLPADERGWISPDALAAALRADTLLVSLMHVNNETGVHQPLDRYCAELETSDAYFHVDAAQGFGKDIDGLTDPRIDLLSISGHKIYGPKGVGALVTRRRGFDAPPLQPLFFGGGQERGLRPGTTPVPLVVGLGEAAAVAGRDHEIRAARCAKQRTAMLEALLPLEPTINGDPEMCVPHTISLAFSGIDSEALMVMLRDHIAISNGSACTSHDYSPSHVLQAMGVPGDRIAETVRLSWCHLTEMVEWEAVADAVGQLR